MVEGCMYVVEDEPNICKIGITIQDPPGKRAPQLSTINSYSLSSF